MSSSNTLATDGISLTPYSLSETLASTEVGGGASGVGISDLGDYYASGEVEGALQEIGETLATAVVTSLNTRVGDVVLDKTDVGLGNVENTTLSTWPGTGNVTTVGTVSSGTWQGTPVADAYIASAVTWHQNMPPGALIMYAGGTAPTGFLLCDGSAVSRVGYAALFAVVGTTYGVGDGATTFNLPDLRSRSPIGQGQGSGLTNRALGAQGGDETVTLTTAEIPSHSHTASSAANGTHSHAGTTDAGGSHSHTINDPGHTHTQTTINDDFNNSGANPPGFSADSAGSRTWSNISTSTTGITVNAGGSHSHTFTTGVEGSHNHGVTVDATGGGGAHANMHPFLSVNFLIKT